MSVHPQWSYLETDSLESYRIEEIEEVKEFLQVVLERCSCQQQLVLDIIGTQHTEKLNKTQSEDQTMHCGERYLRLIVL